MKYYAVATDTVRNEPFGIVVKDGRHSTCHGLHAAGQEWADLYNTGETKTPFEGLPTDIELSPYGPLGFDVADVLDQESAAIPMPQSPALVDSVWEPNRSTGVGLKNVSLTQVPGQSRQLAIDYKAHAFLNDATRSSLLLAVRLNNGNMTPEYTGFQSKSMNRHEYSHLALGDASMRRAAKDVVQTKMRILLNRPRTYSFLDEIPEDDIKVKGLGRTIGQGGRRARRIARGAARSAAGFDPNARDADLDMLIQEGTAWERPKLPGKPDLPDTPRTAKRPTPEVGKRRTPQDRDRAATVARARVDANDAADTRGLASERIPMRLFDEGLPAQLMTDKNIWANKEPNPDWDIRDPEYPEDWMESEMFSGSPAVGKIHTDNINMDIVRASEVFGDNTAGYTVVGEYRDLESAFGNRAESLLDSPIFDTPEEAAIWADDLDNAIENEISYEEWDPPAYTSADPDTPVVVDPGEERGYESSRSRDTPDTHNANPSLKKSKEVSGADFVRAETAGAQSSLPRPFWESFVDTGWRFEETSAGFYMYPPDNIRNYIRESHLIHDHSDKKGGFILPDEMKVDFAERLGITPNKLDFRNNDHWNVMKEAVSGESYSRLEKISVTANHNIEDSIWKHLRKMLSRDGGPDAPSSGAMKKDMKAMIRNGGWGDFGPVKSLRGDKPDVDTTDIDAQIAQAVLDVAEAQRSVDLLGPRPAVTKTKKKAISTDDKYTLVLDADLRGYIEMGLDTYDDAHSKGNKDKEQIALEGVGKLLDRVEGDDIAIRREDGSWTILNDAPGRAWKAEHDEWSGYWNEEKERLEGLKKQKKDIEREAVKDTDWAKGYESSRERGPDQDFDSYWRQLRTATEDDIAQTLDELDEELGKPDPDPGAVRRLGRDALDSIEESRMSGFASARSPSSRAGREIPVSREERDADLNEEIFDARMRGMSTEVMETEYGMDRAEIRSRDAEHVAVIAGAERYDAQPNLNKDIFEDRMGGMSLDEAAEKHGIERTEVRAREATHSRALVGQESYHHQPNLNQRIFETRLRDGMGMEQASEHFRMDPAEVRAREIAHLDELKKHQKYFGEPGNFLGMSPKLVDRGEGADRTVAWELDPGNFQRMVGNKWGYLVPVVGSDGKQKHAKSKKGSGGRPAGMFRAYVHGETLSDDEKRVMRGLNMWDPDGEPTGEYKRWRQSRDRGTDLGGLASEREGESVQDRLDRRSRGEFDEITRVGEPHRTPHHEPDGSEWEFRATDPTKPKKGGRWVEMTDPSRRGEVATRARERRLAEGEAGAFGGYRSERDAGGLTNEQRTAREKRLKKEFEGVSDNDLEEEMGELESAQMQADGGDSNVLEDIKYHFGSLKKLEARLDKLWEEIDRREGERGDNAATLEGLEAVDAPAPGPYDDPSIGDWVNRVRPGGMASERETPPVDNARVAALNTQIDNLRTTRLERKWKEVEAAREAGDNKGVYRLTKELRQIQEEEAELREQLGEAMGVGRVGRGYKSSRVTDDWNRNWDVTRANAEKTIDGIADELTTELAKSKPDKKRISELKTRHMETIQNAQRDGLASQRSGRPWTTPNRDKANKKFWDPSTFDRPRGAGRDERVPDGMVGIYDPNRPKPFVGDGRSTSERVRTAVTERTAAPQGLASRRSDTLDTEKLTDSYTAGTPRLPGTRDGEIWEALGGANMSPEQEATLAEAAEWLEQYLLNHSHIPTMKEGGFKPGDPNAVGRNAPGYKKGETMFDGIDAGNRLQTFIDDLYGKQYPGEPVPSVENYRLRMRTGRDHALLQIAIRETYSYLNTGKPKDQRRRAQIQKAFDSLSILARMREFGNYEAIEQLHPKHQMMLLEQMKLNGPPNRGWGFKTPVDQVLAMPGTLGKGKSGNSKFIPNIERNDGKSTAWKFAQGYDNAEDFINQSTRFRTRGSERPTLRTMVSDIMRSGTPREWLDRRQADAARARQITRGDPVAPRPGASGVHPWDKKIEGGEVAEMKTAVRVANRDSRKPVIDRVGNIAKKRTKHPVQRDTTAPTQGAAAQTTFAGAQPGQRGRGDGSPGTVEVDDVVDVMDPWQEVEGRPTIGKQFIRNMAFLTRIRRKGVTEEDKKRRLSMIRSAGTSATSGWEDDAIETSREIIAHAQAMSGHSDLPEVISADQLAELFVDTGEVDADGSPIFALLPGYMPLQRGLARDRSSEVGSAGTEGATYWQQVVRLRERFLSRSSGGGHGAGENHARPPVKVGGRERPVGNLYGDYGVGTGSFLTPESKPIDWGKLTDIRDETDAITEAIDAGLAVTPSGNVASRGTFPYGRMTEDADPPGGTIFDDPDNFTAAVRSALAAAETRSGGHLQVPKKSKDRTPHDPLDPPNPEPTGSGKRSLNQRRAKTRAELMAEQRGPLVPVRAGEAEDLLPSTPQAGPTLRPSSDTRNMGDIDSGDPTKWQDTEFGTIVDQFLTMFDETRASGMSTHELQEYTAAWEYLMTLTSGLEMRMDSSHHQDYQIFDLLPIFGYDAVVRHGGVVNVSNRGATLVLDHPVSGPQFTKIIEDLGKKGKLAGGGADAVMKAEVDSEYGKYRKAQLPRAAERLKIWNSRAAQRRQERAA